MRSDCPLNFGLEIFGDKWSLLIIRDLMFFGKRNYNEFLASAEGISTNTLAERLNMLEKEKIIKKEKDKSHKQRFLYTLTQKGIDLAPIIINIGLWSEKYGKNLNPDREIIIGAAMKNYSKGVSELKKRLQEEHVKSK
jgi:DNA-binding HxlR family transcriptional regulator